MDDLCRMYRLEWKGQRGFTGRWIPNQQHTLANFSFRSRCRVIVSVPRIPSSVEYLPVSSCCHLKEMKKMAVENCCIEHKVEKTGFCKNIPETCQNHLGSKAFVHIVELKIFFGLLLMVGIVWQNLFQHSFIHYSFFGEQGHKVSLCKVNPLHFPKSKQNTTRRNVVMSPSDHATIRLPLHIIPITTLHIFLSYFTCLRVFLARITIVCMYVVEWESLTPPIIQPPQCERFFRPHSSLCAYIWVVSNAGELQLTWSNWKL